MIAHAVRVRSMITRCMQRKWPLGGKGISIYIYIYIYIYEYRVYMDQTMMIPSHRKTSSGGST